MRVEVVEVAAHSPPPWQTKAGQAPRPRRQALVETIWTGSDRNSQIHTASESAHCSALHRCSHSNKSTVVRMLSDTFAPATPPAGQEHERHIHWLGWEVLAAVRGPALRCALVCAHETFSRQFGASWLPFSCERSCTRDDSRKSIQFQSLD